MGNFFFIDSKISQTHIHSTVLIHLFGLHSSGQFQLEENSKNFQYKQ